MDRLRHDPAGRAGAGRYGHAGRATGRLRMRRPWSRGTARRVTAEAARLAGLRLDALDVSRFRTGEDAEVGEADHPPRPSRRDAASRRAASRRGRARGVRLLARRRARQRGARPSPSRPAAAAAPQPGRVRQRRPRPPGPRRSIRRRWCRPTTRRSGSTTSADVLGVSPTLQERYLAAADRVSALAVGRRHARARGAHLHDSPGRVAGSAHRRAALRHAGRRAHPPHVSARRRVRAAGEAVSQQPRDDARPAAGASVRAGDRRAAACARPPWAGPPIWTRRSSSPPKPATPSTRG